MKVYILLCCYDSSLEVCGVFDSIAKATNKAKRMEQANEVDIGNWIIRSESVQ